MDVEMVLNELSMKKSATSIQVARERMSDFIDVIQMVESKGYTFDST